MDILHLETMPITVAVNFFSIFPCVRFHGQIRGATILLILFFSIFSYVRFHEQIRGAVTLCSFSNFPCVRFHGYFGALIRTISNTLVGTAENGRFKIAP